MRHLTTTPLCLLAALLMAAAASSAAPSITSTSGTFSQGQSVTISGSGFGAGDTTPLLWDDFETGAAGSNLNSSPEIGTWELDTSPTSVYSTAQKHAGSKSAYASHDDSHQWSNFNVYFSPVDRVYQTFWFWYYSPPSGTGQTKLSQIHGDAGMGDFAPGVMTGGFSGDWWASYISTESGANDLSTRVNYSSTPARSTWYRFEMYLTRSSAGGAADGYVKILVNGATQYEKVNCVTRENSAYNWNMAEFLCGMTNWGAASETYIDDAYLNDSWTQVEIGDASTWSACTHTEIQHPSSWSSSSVTIGVNTGSFSNGTAYLYVVDSAGTVNASGYQITIGGGTTYALTVNSGTGGGNYSQGTVVSIVANAPASGKQFDKWIGNTSGIANVNASSTTLTMPAAAQTITATYKDIPSTYTLTVNGGTGGGSYAQGTVVSIAANTAASGQFFDKWTGNTSGIANINAASTTLTMPAANQTITATYASVASGLVTRYTFDIDARDSIGSNNGTLNNGALVTDDAARGKVLSMDGTNDTVSLPTAGMTAGRSELTLSIWIKPDAATGTNTIYDAHSNWYWQYAIRQDVWGTRDSSTGTTGTRDNDLSMPSLTVGQWQHLAFVYSVSGATKAIYLNGSPYNSTSTSVDTLTSPRDGEALSALSDGTFYDGLMDDVRLYSRALNSTEIALLAGTTLYTLTVNSGAGSGTYAQGTVVNIVANAAPSGKTFDKWTGNTSGIANVNASSTTLTMPAANQAVTATYKDITYALTVNSGTGSGNYTPGTVVNISADAPASGKAFDKWIGSTSGIANVNAASTTLIMPAAVQTITASYVNVYVLTVNSGSGGGSYKQGVVVNIVANAPASGKAFDKWTGNTSGIANVNASSTTLTMPAAAQTITATYVNVYVLTVNSGSGGGSYKQGVVVNIVANAPASGKAFDKWTGNTSGIANVNASSTTLTMPAATQTITATYVNAYVLTVNSGSGGGSYTQGTVVNIVANAAPSGQTFSKWIGNTSGIANVNAASTTLTMPAAAQTITATYVAGTTLIVNWGDSAAHNVLPFENWTTVYLGAYVTYSAVGPAGLRGGQTGTHANGAVSGAAGHTFSTGNQMVATWYNPKTSAQTFTPKVSFNDPDEYGSGTSGTWYDMTQLTCPAQGTGTTTYTFSSGSAGTYTRVNVCRYTSLPGADADMPILDKIELGQ